ncbi:putative short-subunit dehydrogenase-like oxidoreductase (DUF2520 family) [Inhella inkyongensis]|uniref:Putative short-subunit dehydrogenase-like oxidoreductase (DUF2520 family) n=1 Tax=Inhella inkyongensis TaxID=392593 RepID=A0A840SAL9_9BURK|nr:DUF2520 domain-containing protein [Inhella inkyongensis]MBB5206056.1 putative short-subunit dehydrogenase-like oxidoreductase (DUF2520 family) [Inhella inkyongensis]
MTLPRIALIGAGRTAAHLGQALIGVRRPAVALGARSAERAGPLAQALGLAVLSPAAAAQAADWVFLCVRDADIAPLCASIPWRADQLVLHCSGATELDALAAAQAAGAQVAGFHPLQLMANPLPTAAEAAQAFMGIRIGIEAGPDARLELEALVLALGAQPLHLQAGQRARYHAAANAAASALLAPLDLASRQAAQALGCTPDQAWAALAPLAEGTLRAARARGLAGALSGPMARAEVAVLSAHLQALAGPDEGLYRALMQALLPLATQRVGAAQAQGLVAVLKA